MFVSRQVEVEMMVPVTPVRPRRPLWKRLLFFGLMLVMMWGALECVAWGVCNYFLDKTGITALYENQLSLAQSGVLGDAQVEAYDCIHPYLGWSLNPDTHPPVVQNGTTYQVNRWGFVGNDERIIKRSPGRVVIGITGGSVATEMSTSGEQAFRQRLQQDPHFAGREIRIVRLGLYGFKQPQQLMALAYLLSVGFEFDWLINLDGYNEAALTAVDNELHGTCLAYPRGWHIRTQDIVDPRVYAQSYELLRIRATRQRIARNVIQSPFHWSPARNLIWYLHDHQLRGQLIDLGVELQQNRDAVNHGYASDGPPSDFTNHEELLAETVALWVRSSRQLQALCTGNGIQYVHTMQPNQYFPGSKPLSAEEQEHFVIPEQAYGKVIAEIYPQMIEAGGQLRQSGIDFHDLTMLFEDHPETIYRDWFCHYNQRGNELLAGAIAELVVAGVDQTDTQETQ